MTLPLPLAKLERFIAIFLRVWIAIGILLRVTRLRDAWDPLALVFYTTPWPVVAVAFLLIAGYHWRRGRKRRPKRALILAAGAIFVWLGLSWYHPADENGPTQAVQPLKVVAWNTAHPHATLPHIFDYLGKENADIMVITECDKPFFPNLDKWRAKFPEHQVVAMSNSMLCIARGELILVEQHRIGIASFVGVYRAKIRGERYTIVQADIYPWEPRIPPLKEVAKVASRYSQEKLICVGDFNTPRESVCFDEFRVFMTHAFEEIGSGPAETWPTYAPALSIDHLWTSQMLRPIRCHLGWSIWSDHRPVIAEFQPLSGQLDRGAVFRNDLRGRGMRFRSNLPQSRE